MAPWLRSLLALMLLACAPSDPPAGGLPSPSLVAAEGVAVQQRDARPTAAPGGAELGVDGDVDGDGFAPPADCDDGDPGRYPGAAEVIGDEIDQDCDGVERCYLDFDNDGHRPDAVTWQFSLDGDCADGAEARRDEPTDDCNDRSASIHPGASEITANGVDETCDGVEVCFADLDNDGYRTLPVTYRNSSDLDCLDNTEAVVTDPTGDCNDNVASVRPNATEIVGNNVDENCDGAELCFRDNDNDGYRTTSTTSIPSADADCDDNGEGRSTDPTTDCNDNAADTNPGATELVGDGIDQTCDGRETCYNGGDDDGFRPPILFLRSSTDLDCNDPLEARASDPATDCDDTRAWVRPGLVESTGDGVDVNCDGAELCWLDADGDGHRPDAVSTAASADADCADLGEALSSAPVDDCDDADSARFPGAAERDGEGADLDCDGQITCFVDGDGDGWHAGLLSTIPWAPFACDAPGLVGAGGQEGDCDDADASVHPGAFDPPDDGVDQSCAGGFLCFADADGDGFRSEGMTLSPDLDCLDPGEAGAAAPLDCDDARADVYAGAPEVVGDLVDQDCDGTERCFADLDGDGARPTAEAAAVTGAEVASSDADCDDPGEAGPAAPEADCNDLDAAIGPGAPESPGDNLDADCDGGELCWLDEDDDGYLGASGALVVSADGDCADPFEAGAGAPAGDCDDGAPSVWPGAGDATGDGVDSDCDGRERCFVDADGDGWRLGPAATVVSGDADCADPGEALLSAPATDCADADPMVHPNAAERVADEIDQDCDARELCLVDADADGFRVDDGATVLSADRDCRDPGEALPTTPIGDCDDTRSGFRPGALEVVADGFDSDCDGLELCRVDADGDGQRPPGDATVASVDGDCADAGEASVHTPPTDCDDLDASVRVGADERPVDGVDQDCDGGEACYADVDDDGWRALGEVRSADLDCDDAGEAVASDPFGDCDDADPARSPSAVEQPGDGIDQDCDGLELCFVDDDRDGWRPLIDQIEASPRLGCDAGDLASNAVPVGDCDDGRGDVRPGAGEGPADLVDSDCDGMELCWVDADGDGNHAGQTRPADLLCTEPGVVGAFALGGDCDDLDPRRYVGALDPGGDGVDQDCAGDALCGADVDGDGARGGEIESGDPDCLDLGELPLDAAADCDDARPRARARPGGGGRRRRGRRLRRRGALLRRRRRRRLAHRRAGGRCARLRGPRARLGAFG